MQALQLLKFVKGVTAIRTQKNMDERSKLVWKWLIQCNEGGVPFNFTVGKYQPKYLENWPKTPKVFAYVYFFGRRWYTKNKA